ncbi:hypothetical protein CBR_g38217 [Chara braunii]|uniref:ABC transporter domain-containing protein n=1 Tax=Chara braunii TaxID=69332 RepID=A0A388LPH2_CHABU|nr:hypothetical protein CBR_g38217 [Chara braunii]|eukprot:GBG84246.1 hypothetical protein CBR_g38217 [Chara braunii]
MAGGGNAQGLELGRVDNGRERVQGELPGLQVLRDKGGTLAMADEGAGSMGKTGRDGEEEIETSDGVMGPESTGTWHGKDAAFVRAGSAGGEEGVTGGMPLDADAGGVFSLPPAVSSRQQLRALLRRQWILKKRSWCQTVFEVVSPMLMMSVLVLAYSFTTVDHYDSAEYAGSEVPFLDQLIALAQNPALVYKWCNKTRPLAEEIGNAFQRGFNASSSQADGIGGWDGSWLPGKWGPPVSEPLSGFWPPTESFPHGAGKWGPPVSEPLGAFWTPTESFPHGAGKWEPPGSEPPSGWPPTESFPRGAPPWQSPDVPQRKPQEVVVPDWAQASVAGLDTPMLPGPGFAQPSMEWRMPPLWDPDDVGSRRLPIPDAVLEEAASCIDPVVAAKQFLANFSQYNGPLPIPSLDTFVVIHRALRSAFLSKPGAYEEALHWQTSFGSILGNLLKLGKLAFSPDTPEVGLLVTYLKERYRFFANMYAGTFETVADALDFAAKLSSVGIETEASPSGEEISRELWAVVVFHKLDVQSGDVDYSIRMNYTSVPQTWRRVHRWHHGLHEAYKRYYSSGFMSLQSAINEYVLKAASGKALVGVAGNWEEGSEEESFLPRPVDGGIWGLPFPIGAYSHNMFYSAVSFVMGLLMCMSTLYPLGMLVKGIVEEKETRSRETMRIMGLRAWVLTLSWGITYLLIFAVAGLMVTVLLTGTFLPASDKSVVFVLFYLYGCSLVSFGLFMSVFFSRAKLASVVAPFAHFAALLPRYVFFRASEGQAISGKMGASLLPPTAFAFGVDLLAQYEGAGEGLTWHEVFIGSPGENGSPHHEYGMGKVLGMLTVDAILFAFLGWYLEQVLPSQYGLRRPVWFFMMPSYWVSESCWESFLVRMRHSLRIARLGVYEAVPMKDPAEHYHADGVIKCDEELEKCGRNGHRAAIQVQGLTKVYPGGKVAVEGLNLDVYEGQITALLGHNGAGKSTVISMLTGLIAPTAGEIRIWGCDIQTHQDAVRRIIGVCPQQNVLFPRLTVEEHLELYGTIKGLPRKALGLAVLEMVERVGLMDKLHTEVVDLSGGMKRKLQVALAVIGGSKVLFLDEPTSGMDPHSRRSMWTLLKSFKAGRVIVLTTHYMDEADLLSDRIAIMSEGRLMCCGSSLFLKGRYGPGYNLTMTKENSECDDNAVYSLVKKHVPESTRLICAGGEMAFKLPLRMKHKFAALFQEIEEKRSSLFIGGYGVSMTTLEEVFMGFTRRGESKEASFFEGQEFSLEALKAANRENRGFAGGQGEDRTILPLTEGNSRHLDPVHSTRGNRDGDGEDLEAGQVGGCKSVAASGHCYQVTYSYTCQRFFHIWIELLKKRAIIAKRDVKGLINSIALPVGAVAFVLLILRLNINPAGPSLDLSMEMYTGLGCKTTFTEVPSVRLGSRWPGFLGAKYLKLTVASHVNDSVSMSHELLSTLGETPRYDALIYNDTQLQKYNLSAILDFDIDRYGPFLNQLLHVDAFTKDKSKMQHKVRRDRKSVTGKNGYGMVVPLTIMHNTSSDHALPAMLTELAQAQIRALRNDSKASLKVRSHPLPLTKNEALQIQTFLTVLAALFVLIPFCYLAASFAVFVVKERTVKAKHLQLVSGVNVYEYWCAAYTWDLINYFVIASITMLVFLIYQDQAFTGTASKGLGAFLLMMLFGASSIPLSYCYSFLFKNSASAQVAIAGFHFIAGVVMLVTSFIMGEIEKTQFLETTGWRGKRRSGGTILAFCPRKVGGPEVLNGELGGVESSNVEVVIGGGWSGVVMEKAGAGGSGRGLVMGVEESIVVKHAREEVSKGHVGFVGEGGCKVFVADSFDAGDERKVGNDGGGEVVAEGADVLDEAVRGTGLAEVVELFKVVINGFLGAEGGSEKVGPLEEGVMWSSRGSAVADFSHPSFGSIAEEAGGGNGESVGKGHVVEVKRVLELGWEEENVLVGEAGEGHDVVEPEGTGDVPVVGNNPGEGVEAEVIGDGVIAGVVELVVVLKEVVGGELWHCGVNPRGDLGIGGTDGGDGGGRHDGLGKGMRVRGGKRGHVDGRGMRRWKNLGRPMVIMFLEAIAFFLATLAIDKDFLQWLQNLVRDCGIKISRMYGSQRQLTFTLSRRFYIMNQRAFHVDEDVDVATERVRVASGAGSNDVVVISDLSKVFRGDKAGGVKVAVSNLSLGIPPGECFGFLGVNGAGKTTTLSILTGDLRPTHGDAFICGHSVVNGLPGAQRLIGYCPQFDPLLDLMTGREHLLMYARLKGIPEQNVHQLVKEVITAVGLSECADRVAGSYSGGNKRKLSLAIALVGNPMAIFLDEPSSGMDPMARRAMWDIISSAIMKQKMCIVLTTHSMEECEALCGRVGVMVAGQLVCLGSTQHLKSRFGVGYHLELRSDEERVSSVKTFVETEFTGAILEEEHGERLKYQLPIEGLSLSQVFGTIEDQKERIGIDDYSVSQSTLEQIFLLFARSVEKGWTPMPN